MVVCRMNLGGVGGGWVVKIVGRRWVCFLDNVALVGVASGLGYYVRGSLVRCRATSR